MHVGKTTKLFFCFRCNLKRSQLRLKFQLLRHIICACDRTVLVSAKNRNVCRNGSILSAAGDTVAQYTDTRRIVREDCFKLTHPHTATAACFTYGGKLHLVTIPIYVRDRFTATAMAAATAIRFPLLFPLIFIPFFISSFICASAMLLSASYFSTSGSPQTKDSFSGWHPHHYAIA